MERESESEKEKSVYARALTTTRWNVKYLYILIYYFIDCN